ncbi:MAG: polysaccharide biosynthesis/export family protein [Pirellulales bacterium]|nr:polysaccharide biosynthesis/export family protein [Pirellulales bacterium]
MPPIQGGANIDLSQFSTPSEPSSIIGPGDVIKVTLATGYEEKALESILVRVNDQGIANIPLVGEVAVAGMDPAEAEQRIASTSIERGIFQQPHVTVLIEHKKTYRVTVVGAVEEPGVVQLDRSSCDLLGALARAGGLTKEAGSELIIHRQTPMDGPVAQGRPDPSTGIQPARFSEFDPPQLPAASSQKINLRDLTKDGLASYQLGDGDVVMVYKDEPRFVHVMGLVRDPKQIEILPQQNIRILDAIAIAGGRTMQLADKVKVIRQIPDQPEPIVIDVSIRDAKRNSRSNLILAPEDVVTVEETPVTFVLGAFQNLVRIGISGTSPLF